MTQDRLPTALEAMMTGDQLIKQFEDGTTPPAAFHHADHVRLAFEYLCRYSVLEALERFSDALKRFATARGKAQLYHETITWTYLLLIHERMARAGCAQTWEEFAKLQSRSARLERRRADNPLPPGDARLRPRPSHLRSPRSGPVIVFAARILWSWNFLTPET